MKSVGEAPWVSRFLRDVETPRSGFFPQQSLPVLAGAGPSFPSVTMPKSLRKTPAPPLMAEFCDVALPLPLDIVFTYGIPAEMEPVVGGRVLVPFRQQRMSGVVMDLHDRKPKVQIKNLIR